MSIVLDLIGSIFIASIVLMIGLTISLNISSTNDAMSANVNVQETLVDLQQSIEYDFRKIGYGIENPKDAVTLADSSHIKFKADIDNNGVLDEVEWFLGPAVSHFPNKKIRPLYRRINGGTPQGAPGLGVTVFRLNYLDQDGKKVSPFLPVPVTLLGQVWNIETTIQVESPYRVADQIKGIEEMDYSAAFWRQSRIASRNIKRN